MPETVAPLSTPPTEAEKAIKTFDENSQELFFFLEPRHRKSWVDFWYNPKYTPQEACDKAGNKAYLIFELSKQSQILLKLLNPAYEMLWVPEGCEVVDKWGGFIDIIDNRAPETPPPPIATPEKQPAPKLEWKGEGVNPEFAPPEENNTPSE